MFFSDGSWYTQNMFARFIADVFGEGVVDGIDNELAVSANSPTNMAVQVKTGRSYIKGYIHEILTDPVQLTIADADPTNPRIDRIILRLDVSTNRRIRAIVLQGDPSSSPTPRALTQTSSIWEISLAQVRVNANATVITSSNITDERTFMTVHRENLPLASTSEFGSVKVGSGLNVSNGLLSVGTNTIRINHTSATNNNGFAVGTSTATVNAFSAGSATPPTSSYTNYGSQYTPITGYSVSSYQPFLISGFCGQSITLTVSSYETESSYSKIYVRAIRVSDSSVLGSTNSRPGTISLSFALPQDWNISTDKVQFQIMQAEGTYGRISSSSISAGSVTSTVYYDPRSD